MDNERLREPVVLVGLAGAKQPWFWQSAVAIVTGDYFLPDPITQELTSLGAAIRFKPLWLEDLIALAKTLVA